MTSLQLSRRSLLPGAGTAALSRMGRFAEAATAAPRPNIVILLSGDIGWDQVGFNGGKEVPTPNIDAIAREGVKMTQFYVQPVCSPSRSCIMTGRYPWKNGMERRPSTRSAQGMLHDERTVAQALSDADYETWMVGKWHLGEWRTHHLPLARGFQHHYGFYGALIDSFTHTRDGILDWHRNGKPVIEEGYSTFLLANEASRKILEHDGKRPFFLYLPFNAVHGPNLAPEPYLKKYEHLGRKGPERAQLPGIVGKLRGRLAYHKQFARAEEPPETIPGEPAVYSEVENAQYGKWVAEQMKTLHLTGQTVKKDRKKGRKK